MTATKEETKKVLTRVGALVKRAQSPLGDDDEEARTAAVQAALMMREHELVILPKAQVEEVNERIRQAMALAKKAESEGQNKLIMGVLGGMMLGRKGLF